MKAQKKSGRNWLIPIIAKKPIDNRVKSGVYQKNKKATVLPLPISISDYHLASTEYYYIDKTMLIKDFLDKRPMVSLFTIPAVLVKPLIWTSCEPFFEMSDEDTSVYFKDKNI